tara:strand:+ start:530 stop:859 length:330 start_codon:yes stop_codon:yes gene_type:complete
MSLIFKPTIADTFEHIKPFVPIMKAVPPPVIVPEVMKLVFSIDGRNQSMWNSYELQLLVNMRALRLTYRECGGHLNRSTNSCGSAVHTHDLYAAIESKQKKLIEGVLSE